MEVRYKVILLLILVLMWGGAQWAKADDDLSAATDNENIQLKLETDSARWEQEQRHKPKKRRVRAPQSKGVKPCAGDDDCQRTKQDAVDRENGIGGQED